MHDRGAQNSSQPVIKATGKTQDLQTVSLACYKNSAWLTQQYRLFVFHAYR